MVVDFSKVNVKERPTLILQNLDDTPIGVLATAFNIEADFCFNEISTLSFDLPAYVDGKETEGYSKAVGMRIVDLKNYGRFLLIDPKTDDDGVKQIKECTAYSLEYEFTFKKMPLEAGTYNFWNPVAPEGTILGKILELMPSWSLVDPDGKVTVDATLVDKYRTFDDSGEQNIYNFIKSNLQESYGCIFTFDTYNRVIYVKDITNEAPVEPVYLSLENLVKKVSIEEDTESIITQLNVCGADGVDIRSVNPMGTNSIIELGYFMTLDNFTQEIIDKYISWKETFTSYQQSYFNYTIEEVLKTAQLVTEQAALATLEGELTSLENLQAVIIQAIAQKLKTQDDLDAINGQITEKKSEIKSKQKEIQKIQAKVEELNDEMVAINERTDIKNFFTEDQYKVINRYLKEDTITEESFVVPEVDTFDATDESVRLNGSIFNITRADVIKVENSFEKDIYSISGGMIACASSDFDLDAKIIRASLDYDEEKNFVFTARLSEGTLNDTKFPNACISISGKANAVTSNVEEDEEVGGVISEGTSLSFRLGESNLYFTRSTTEYEQRAVEWDLFDYGQEMIQKVAWPSYDFSLDLANFLAISEFEPFKNNLELGNKLYFKRRDGTVMKPILIKVHLPFDDLDKFSIELSSKYNSNDSEFAYEDFYNDVQTAGKTIESGKWTYSQFVNSGAQTSLDELIKNALDIAKNRIISSSGQAISWDQAGFRLRRWSDEDSSQYDPYQIWMNNSQIMFTTDNWETANLAIGQIQLPNGNIGSGVIADSLIGRLIAGSSMIIESEKKDGDTAVFRVDGEGASLHNATFDIYNANKTQITLNPYSGIAIGQYPLYTDDEYTIDEDKAVFWVDTDGNIHLKGTLEGCDGEFSGELKAATGTFSGELSAASGTFNGIVRASDFQTKDGNSWKSMMTKDNKFDADYLELYGITVKDANGGIIMTIGQNGIDINKGSISWSDVTGTDSVDTAIQSAQSKANSAYNLADDAYDLAYDNQLPNYIKKTKITSTTIESPTISGGDIKGARFYDDDGGAYFEIGDGGYGDFNMYASNGAKTFYIYDGASYVTFGTYSHNWLRYNDVTEITVALGQWSFETPPTGVVATFG